MPTPLGRSVNLYRHLWAVSFPTPLGRFAEKMCRTPNNPNLDSMGHFPDTFGPFYDFFPTPLGRFGSFSRHLWAVFTEICRLERKTLFSLLLFFIVLISTKNNNRQNQ